LAGGADLSVKADVSGAVDVAHVSVSTFPALGQLKIWFDF